MCNKAYHINADGRATISVSLQFDAKFSSGGHSGTSHGTLHTDLIIPYPIASETTNADGEAELSGDVTPITKVDHYESFDEKSDDDAGSGSLPTPGSVIPQTAWLGLIEGYRFLFLESPLIPETRPGKKNPRTGRSGNNFPDEASVDYPSLGRWLKDRDGYTSDASGNFGRMLYFSATTATTLGLGDIVPVSPTSRLFVTLETVAGIFFAGMFLNALASKASRSTN